MAKYIFITGGVISSLGKGIASASIGRLLEEAGLKVTLQKLDPYINVDPGTMSPYQHGEVYVTDDGAETDLDLGHYERFTSARMTRANNFTTGQVYDAVIKKERKGDYLGRTVQVVPHIIDEIKGRIRKLVELDPNLDVVIGEVGGTVGDIEGLPFLEAIRQFRLDLGWQDVLYIHLTYVPYIRAAEEIKTKPTQHSVGTLRQIGIQPDILLCRTERDLSDDVKRKIALFCNVDPKAVIQAKDVDSVYKVPLLLAQEGLGDLIIQKLALTARKHQGTPLGEVIERMEHPKGTVKMAVVGKYIEHQDAYKSIYEAIIHAGFHNSVRVEVTKVDAEKIEKDGPGLYLKDVSGILVPGGFGTRGIEGKISAIQYAREHRIPFFGICLGMQCSVIEFARHVCGFDKANSTEFEPETPHPVICLLSEQQNVKNLGGTMRLGASPCELKPGSKVYEIYGRHRVMERHRHRYELNNGFREIFEKNGLKVTGLSPDGVLAELIELEGHPWFVACQYHPEFQSKPDRAHPLFASFIQAVVEHQGREKGSKVMTNDK
ncbi:MAG: CTP synthase [Chlamydiae bacterium]|nr:CTP synthase [Chlamydiota bacterium]MBI3267065.1 CTP synthase [Chlamydiota bacterium]